MEVSIAIAIFAVAVLPVVALMAMGVQSNQESAERSRAAMIAESIFSELRQSSAATGPIVRVQSEGMVEDQYWSPPGSLSSVGGRAVFVGYGAEGQAMTPYAPGDYDQGDPSAPLDVVAMVRVGFEDADSGGVLYEDAGSQIEESEGLIRVEVSVEFPVAAGVDARRAYAFTAYMNLTDMAAVVGAP